MANGPQLFNDGSTDVATVLTIYNAPVDRTAATLAGTDSQPGYFLIPAAEHRIESRRSR